MPRHQNAPGFQAGMPSHAETDILAHTPLAEVLVLINFMLVVS
jgi:hypothetical protein